ncbi:MAG: ABC transporter ATP-binding protein [Dehalococcoidia bacterium]|nr:ABC transporter ATP-binding protein [Dehalococcoidia bacterium]
MLIDVRNLSLDYGGVHALRGVSLQAQAKGLVVLVGANGAGKSSLIRCIMGLVPRSGGEIWLGGRRIDGLPPHQIAKLGLSIVPEGRRMFAQMSLLDNLLTGAYRITKRSEIKDSLDEVWHYFPVLKDRKHQLAGSLSGGEQQMLALARALMAQPNTLLLDEPSLGLAPLVVREVAALIVRLNRERGLTILVAEQNARMGLKIADYAYVLENGNVVLKGRGQDLLQNDYVVKAYLGRAEGA